MKKWIIVILAIALSFLMLSSFGRNAGSAPAASDAAESAPEALSSTAQDQPEDLQNDVPQTDAEQIPEPVQETPNYQEGPPVELEVQDDVTVYLEETQDVGGM